MTDTAENDAPAGTCDQCRNGNHENHVRAFGGICVGCPCPVIPPDMGGLP